MNNRNYRPNRLINEKSPYLLQHAYNPVDWYPWGEEAIEKAKEEDKPIFLSIGYSSCHWCHVMERESFENEETAEILNKYFVSIKLDREERPDIDNIYMDACMAINGQGGWPLSCFLDHQLLPFYAGTYFPKKSHYGMAGFDSVLLSIAEMWLNDRDKLNKTSNSIIKYMAKRLDIKKETPKENITDMAYNSLSSDFDSDYGGFGEAPKFPALHNVLFLLRYGMLNNNKTAYEMVDKTLTGMAKGGIFDHIGGGFSRYSTDKKWLVPHFEKMLYDNAMAIMAYTEAGSLINDKFFAITRRIIEYLKREMLDTSGGFYTAQDADSEGIEGKFYCWTVKEIAANLEENEAIKFCDLYDITDDGNFEDTNIPNLIGNSLNEDNSDFSRECFRKLLKARNMRIPPFKDDKILTLGNGLMTAALSIAGRIMKESEYIQMAEKCIQFILNKLSVDGRLMSSYRDGKTSGLATSDDYAFVIWGCIELYESTFNARWLKTAIELTNKINELFWDDENGGYYMSGSDVFDVFIRQKNMYDGALPSGNSVMTLNLIRLARLTFDFKYEEKANEIISMMASNINLNPSAYTAMLCALLFLEHGGDEIVVTSGNGYDKLMDELPALHPFSTIMTYDNNMDKLSEVVPEVKKMKPVKNKAAVYICRKGACDKPITDADELKERLTAGKS